MPAEEMQYETYQSMPVLYQEDQIPQLPGMVVKKILLELCEGDREFPGAGFCLVQGSFEVAVGRGAGLAT